MIEFLAALKFIAFLLGLLFVLPALVLIIAGIMNAILELIEEKKKEKEK